MIFGDDAGQINGGIVGGTIGAIGVAVAWLVQAYTRVVKDRREASAEDDKREMERERLRAETEATARREWRELTELQRKEINELRERITKAEMESRECEKRYTQLKRELDELRDQKGLPHGHR